MEKTCWMSSVNMFATQSLLWPWGESQWLSIGNSSKKNSKELWMAGSSVEWGTLSPHQSRSFFSSWKLSNGPPWCATLGSRQGNSGGSSTMGLLVKACLLQTSRHKRLLSLQGAHRGMPKSRGGPIFLKMPKWGQSWAFKRSTFWRLWNSFGEALEMQERIFDLPTHRKEGFQQMVRFQGPGCQSYLELGRRWLVHKGGSESLQRRVAGGGSRKAIL